MTDKNTKKTSYSSLTGFHRAVPIILFAVAVFTGLCFIMQDIGALGHAISSVFLGLFSYGAYLIPFLVALHALFYPSDLEGKTLLSRTVFSVVTLVSVSALIYAITYWGQDTSFAIGEFYKNGQNLVGGGFIGSIVAYGIIKIFGAVGLVVITVAIFALYITFFFSKGHGAVARLLICILKVIVNVGAFIEEKIKQLIKFIMDRIAKSKNNKNNKKTAELGDDEFFGVDNSMERLEITELGIVETRTSDTIESRPTLHDKVYHKSAVADEYSDSERPKREYADETSYSDDTYRGASRRTVDTSFGMGSSPLRSSVEDFDPEKDIFVDYEETSDSKTGVDSTKDFGLDATADSVFTSDFDPFKLAMCETLATKPSSKCETAPRTSRDYTVTESISELTEEDVEKARAREAFERRKAAIIASRKPQSVPVKGDSEIEGTPKSVAFHETAAESVHTVDVEDSPVSLKVEKNETAHKAETEDIPSYTLYMKEEEVSTTYERKFEDAAARTSPSVPSKEETRFTEPYEMKFGTPDFEDEDHDEHTEHSYGEETFSPERQESSYHSDVAVDRSYIATSETTPSAEKDEPVFKTYPSPDADGANQDSAFRQEDDGETQVEEVATLVTERTMIFDSESDGETLDRTEFDADESPLDADEDEIDEDEEFVSGEEYGTEAENDDGEWCGEEIPPEEQSAAVKGYRDMFTVLRNEDKAAREAEETEDAEDPDSPDETDDEICYSEDNGKEDEPPFDTDGDLDGLVDKEEPEPTPAKKKQDYSNYRTPPLDLLGLEESHNDEQINAEIQENTRILIETLESFNVTASIKGVDRGPRITRYEVVPARGVKVKEITGRFEDIELNLAAEGVRMEAPIPGKSAIGFEIPNKHPATVRLRELLETDEFMSAKSTTFVCIGKDVAGNPVFGDISKYPHALICGATGMGKSVCINSIMISMLFKSRPDQVKFIMIDPKKVEFKIYSGIPHLLIPVITEAKQAAGALMWAVEEMERRYELIEQHCVRNIEAYNEKVTLDPSIGEKLPKIVIVIDELADLMMQVRDPVEDLVMRIAQKARAAGIHLIIGTQRPSVQVITGAIKANIPSRISCKVTSQVDSRTIFDMGGAEKLLNRGDMLYWPVDRTAALRVQGAFVADGEVEAVMNFLKNQSTGDQYDDEVMAEINKAAQKCGNKKSGGAMVDDDTDDDDQPGYYSDQRFLDAVELAIRSKKISTSLLQRKLSIGYGKAAKYIDAMESIGIVSEPNGQRPRDVLITMDEWHEKLSRVDLD